MAGLKKARRAAVKAKQKPQQTQKPKGPAPAAGSTYDRNIAQPAVSPYVMTTGDVKKP